MTSKANAKKGEGAWPGFLCMAINKESQMWISKMLVNKKKKWKEMP